MRCIGLNRHQIAIYRMITNFLRVNTAGIQNAEILSKTGKESESVTDPIIAESRSQKSVTIERNVQSHDFSRSLSATGKSYMVRETYKSRCFADGFLIRWSLETVSTTPIFSCLPSSILMTPEPTIMVRASHSLSLRSHSRLHEDMRTVFANKKPGCERSAAQHGLALFVNSWQQRDRRLHVEVRPRPSSSLTLILTQFHSIPFHSILVRRGVEWLPQARVVWD